MLVTGRKRLKDKYNPREADLIAMDKALKASKPLYIACYLRKELAALSSKDSKTEAGEYLDSCLTKAEESGVTILEKVAKWLA